MPELPEVEAVCRRLREDLDLESARALKIKALRVLRPAVTRPQASHDVEAACADRVLEKIERRGKNILLFLRGGDVLLVHLRMTGNLYVVPDHRFLTSAVRAVWELAGGRGIVFEDPRALGKLHLHAATDLERVLHLVGLEPLSPGFTKQAFLDLAKSSRKPAKLFLMDQRYIAGLGNIYAAEALFRAGIDPRKPIGKLRRARLESLHAAIIGVLTDAVNSVYLAYAKPGRILEAESQVLMVYGREGEPCRICGRAIRRIPQGGRSTYFCVGCQT